MKKTEKITVSLTPETIKLANEKYADFGFENRSELIETAIREYISRDILKQFSGELVDIYESIERSEIKQLEQHLSKLAYKIAVEQAQMYLLIASMVELPYKIDSRLRAKAVKMVNELKGFVPLSKAARHGEIIPSLREEDSEDEAIFF